jgi:hypothetical protein
MYQNAATEISQEKDSETIEEAMRALLELAKWHKATDERSSTNRLMTEQ